MTRRRVLLLLGAGAFWAPHSTLSQPQPGKVARIGFLGLPAASTWTSPIEALRAGLRDFGYVEGKNLLMEFRWAEENYERAAVLAAELVQSKVDVIVTHSTVGIRAAMRATSSIPIVMAATGDAVAAGLVGSLARPGGNVTGSSFLRPQLAAKRLELLSNVLPRVKRVAVLLNDLQGSNTTLEHMEAGAKTHKVGLHVHSVQRPQDISGTFVDIIGKRAEAVVVLEDPMLVANAGQIAALTVKYRLPSIGFTQLADAGGLVGYGASIAEMHRRAAYFIDRILKGAKPADLPVEQPTKFELILNLKSAKALGIAIPQSVLLRADKVIE